jgi:hypothetical protein
VTTAATTNWTWDEVSARRLRRHGLVGEPHATPAAAAAAMCGAHAQVMTAGELSLGLRVAGAAQADVRRALWDEHALVKTFGPRGTVHLLPTAELPLWTGALASVAPASPSPFPDGVRFTPEQTDALVAAVGEALADAELTVDELTEALADLAGPWAVEEVMPAFQTMWPRWRQATHTAAFRGALCFGANRGRKVTYTSPRRWLPGFRPEPGPAAVSHLVTRYLGAYGPATPKQFARWLAANETWATRAFEAAPLVEVTLAGEPGVAYLPAGDDAKPEPLPDSRPGSLRLLPYFDAYGVGGHPRHRLFPGRAGERALAGSQAGNFPVLLVDGTVAGVWHQRPAGRSLNITVEPLAPLSRALADRLAEEATRVADFFAKSPRLAVGEVTVGPHA